MISLVLLTSWVAVTATGSLSNVPPESPDLSRFVYPLAAAVSSPQVLVDTTDAPDSAAWAEQAKRLVAAWFPHVCQLLATEKYTAPAEVRLVFKKELRVPAYTSGTTITVNARWVRDHPEDLGLIVHELTHIVQSYPPSRRTPGWLVEGIADFVRWWRYEPEAPRTRIDPQKASYRDSYRTTAAFLAWVSHKYDERIVPRLDASIRLREDPLPVFKELTGKTVDDLWTEFAATIPPR